MISFKTLAAPFQDFLFVVTCYHCGERLRDGERRICNRCWESVTPVRAEDYTFRVLMDRFREGGVVDDAVALCYFEKGKLLQQLAHSLKYQRITEFGRELGWRLAEKVPHRKFDAIIPVPLNRRKERERGYNQSDAIAEGMSPLLGVPVRSAAVQRVKYTGTQTKLSVEERKTNIAEAFALRFPEQVKGGDMLLVDDIITTGATVQEIAAVLKAAGARSVTAAAAGLAKLGEDSYYTAEGTGRGGEYQEIV